MIDIHCHPLPGVDDGAKSIEEAAEMCRIAAKDGVTHLVATPHCNYTYTFDPGHNRQLVRELQEKVGETPKLLLGCDLHFSYDNIQTCLQGSRDFTINHTSYLLVELPDQFIPDHFTRVFYEIQVAGLKPIITHPERNPVLQRKPDLLRHWVSIGCLVQVTAQSYTGGFGSRPHHYAQQFLDAGLVHFFASDAHGPRKRPPLLSPCYQKVAVEKGQELADLLLRKNAEAVIYGRPLPPQPESSEFQAQEKKRRWFSFLWGR